MAPEGNQQSVVVRSFPSDQATTGSNDINDSWIWLFLSDLPHVSSDFTEEIQHGEPKCQQILPRPNYW